MGNGITRARLGDGMLAIALAAAGVLGTPAQTWWATEPGRANDWIGYALILAASVIVVLRRRWPIAVLAASAVITSAYLVAGYPMGPILLAFAVAVYTAARHRPLSRSVPVALAALLVLLLHVVTGSAPLADPLDLVPGSMWVVVPFLVGTTVRLAREAGERERAEAVRRGVDNERLRVAQEVHDVVGHGLAAIKMQSDIALHLLGKSPEHAESALRAISRTSSEALDELRATLAVVRNPARSSTGSSREPDPGLGRVDDLGQRMRDAGVAVDIRTSGEPRPLPAAVDLAGYRVVQESLTNVLKHSPAKVANVRIGYHTDAVVIEVSNPVSGVTAVDDGLGIAGMRQRVAALGGSFAAGPVHDGRFEVRVSLPLDGDR
jgi:signal transduction histidine kinase